MSEASEQVHAVERWTAWCHMCRECSTVFVCMDDAMAFFVSEGYAGPQAEAAGVILRCIVGAESGARTVGWLSRRQWARVQHGACRHNAALAGLRPALIAEVHL